MQHNGWHAFVGSRPRPLHNFNDADLAQKQNQLLTPGRHSGNAEMKIRFVWA